MIRAFLRAALVGALALGALAAVSQTVDWPTKPVKFIVPFPPGGSVDPLARMLGVRLADSLGQQFIVENKTGASGAIGTTFVAKSAPDGYTYVFVFDTHAVNPALIPNLPFDTANDLAPVMLVGTAPMAIVTNAAKPYRNFGDVIRAAKAGPQGPPTRRVGKGSPRHPPPILVQQGGGFKVPPRSHQGGGPRIQDARGGPNHL